MTQPIFQVGQVWKFYDEAEPRVVARVAGSIGWVNSSRVTSIGYLENLYHEGKLTLVSSPEKKEESNNKTIEIKVGQTWGWLSHPNRNLTIESIYGDKVKWVNDGWGYLLELQKAAAKGEAFLVEDAPEKKPENIEFKPGQVWKFKSGEFISGGTRTVVRVDTTAGHIHWLAGGYNLLSQFQRYAFEGRITLVSDTPVEEPKKQEEPISPELVKKVCETLRSIPTTPAEIREENKRRAKEWLDSDLVPKYVLDGFGRRRGKKWEALVRYVLGTVENANKVKAPFFVKDWALVFHNSQELWEKLLDHAEQDPVG